MPVPISLEDAKQLQAKFQEKINTLRQENNSLLDDLSGLKRELDTANQALDTLQGKYDALFRSAKNALDVLRAIQINGPLEPGTVNGTVKSLTKVLGGDGD